MPGDDMGFGKYQVEVERGSSVEIIREGTRIYSGKWYDTLVPFFERIKQLTVPEQEYQLELTFDLPAV